MQTFLPYESFRESAKVLDWRRLGKQRVEGMQIINANPSELAGLLKPLGLDNSRSTALKKMSEGYVKGFKSVDELYGIGQYAKDSWEIFQNNNRKVNPTDKVLMEYLRVEYGK